jgi:S-formylglutathione hydrolase FrmB
MRGILFSLSLLVSLPAFAYEHTETCGGSRWSGYEWCVNVPKGFSSGAVVYYLHGNGGEAPGWPLADNAALQDLLSAGAANPAVITVSFGKRWFLSEEGGLLSAAKLRTFLDKIMPEAEAALPIPPATRALLGKSMGGFNAIQGAAKASAPFRKVAILCPAQPPLTPFSSPAELEAFVDRGRAYLHPDLVENWTKYFRKEYPSQDAWAKHDPLRLAAQITAAGKPIFLQSDDHDVFGFYPNAVKFRDALAAAGAKVEWHVTEGGLHCEMNAVSTKALAEFLLN